MLFEDNVACIAQIKKGYIKGYRTKHISPNFFYTMKSRRVVKLMFNKYAQVIFSSQVNQKVIVSTNVKFLEDDYMISNKASSDTNWRALMTLPQ